MDQLFCGMLDENSHVGNLRSFANTVPNGDLEAMEGASWPARGGITESGSLSGPGKAYIS